MDSIDSSDFINCTFDGITRLGQLGYRVDWLWYDITALILFILIFLAVAYLVLFFIKKEK